MWRKGGGGKRAQDYQNLESKFVVVVFFFFFAVGFSNYPFGLNCWLLVFVTMSAINFLAGHGLILPVPQLVVVFFSHRSSQAT